MAGCRRQGSRSSSRWASACACCAPPRPDAQGGRGRLGRLRAASRQPRIRHRQRLDPGAAAGGERAPLLAGRTGRRRDHQLARVAADPRAAARPQRRRAAPRPRSRWPSCSATPRRPRRAAGASPWSACAAPASRRSASMLADDLEVPVRRAEPRDRALAGCSIREIHDLYGTNAYRRYERRALEETMQPASRGGDRHAGRHRLRPGDLQPAARALHDRLAAGLARRAHEPRRGAGRHPADGGEPRGDGRPAAHPRPAAPPSTPRPTRRSTPAARREDESLRGAACALAGELPGPAAPNMKQSS